MTKKPKAILRVEKIKTRNELIARSNHNNRTSEKGLEHTGRGGVVLLGGKAKAEDAWDERTAAVGFDTTKKRKDGVLALEWVMSASKEWWNSATPKEQTAFIKDALGFLAKEAGGKDNICQAYLHGDESTIHIQAITVPLLEKEVKARGRGSAGKPPRRQWCLSAKDFIGGTKHRLEELQTDYAAAIAHHGIERGTPKKETGARNLNPTKWRAEQARLKAAAEADRSAAATELTEARKERTRATQARREAETYTEATKDFFTSVQKATRGFLEKWAKWSPATALRARREMAQDMDEAITSMPTSFKASKATASLADFQKMMETTIKNTPIDGKPAKATKPKKKSEEVL